MKLAKVQIENFRHLGGHGKPFVLDFTDALGSVHDFILLVGPNTSGKTTILDAIAAAMGPGLGMPTLRPGFTLSPRRIVRRGELNAKVTCWLRFSPEEITATRELFRLAEIRLHVPDTPEVQLIWTYPDPRSEFASEAVHAWNIGTVPRPHSPQGVDQYVPGKGQASLAGRSVATQLLSTGRADWSWYERVGGVFTFDQERTGLGKTISRHVWNIIHGTTEEAREKEELRTTEPRTILIDMALQSLVPQASPTSQTSDAFRLVQEQYERVCAPRKLKGAVRDELGEFDISFSDGESEYSYEGLSSGEKNVLLFLIRFAAEHIHNSIVMIDELELNQHPIWQRRLVHMVPRMGNNNQIIATTHSDYLRGAVRPDAVIDLGSLDDHGNREPG